MRSIFPLAGAFLVLLEVILAVCGGTSRYLPLGGSHTAQLAIILGLAYVCYEFATVWKK
jgi:hypothetical protein